MSINIGDKNKIKDSTISNNSEIVVDDKVRKTWVQKHPVISGIIISILAGLILMLNFWDRIIILIENMFKV